MYVENMSAEHVYVKHECKTCKTCICKTCMKNMQGYSDTTADAQR